MPAPRHPRPAAGPCAPAPPAPRPPRARPPWWPLALGGLVAAAGASWAARAAAPPADPRPAADVVIPQDARTALLLDRSARRGEVARAVARGELGLSDAAAAFGDLVAGDPAALACLRVAYPAGADDERHARAVIRRVRVELALRGADPGPAARLEAELARRLAAGPRVPPAGPDLSRSAAAAAR